MLIVEWQYIELCVLASKVSKAIHSVNVTPRNPIQSQALVCPIPVVHTPFVPFWDPDQSVNVNLDTLANHPIANLNVSKIQIVPKTRLVSTKSAKILAQECAVPMLCAKWLTTIPSALVLKDSPEIHSTTVTKVGPNFFNVYFLTSTLSYPYA